MSGGTNGLSKHRKSIAVTVSVGLHALLFCAFTVSTSSELSNIALTGEGEADVQGVELDLMTPDDSASAMAHVTQPLPPPASRADAFMAMTDVGQAPFDFPSSPSSPAQSLSDALGENPFDASQSAQPASKARDEAHVKTSDKAHQTPNDLWKAIAPCWNRIADKNTLPVTLEVSFSPIGNLAKPPVIRRNSSVRISDQMLRSETQAISALAQCGPYLMVFGRDNVQVGFPKG